MRQNLVSDLWCDSPTAFGVIFKPSWQLSRLDGAAARSKARSIASSPSSVRCMDALVSRYSEPEYSLTKMIFHPSCTETAEDPEIWRNSQAW